MKSKLKSPDEGLFIFIFLLGISVLFSSCKESKASEPYKEATYGDLVRAVDGCTYVRFPSMNYAHSYTCKNPNHSEINIDHDGIPN